MKYYYLILAVAIPTSMFLFGDFALGFGFLSGLALLGVGRSLYQRRRVQRQNRNRVGTSDESRQGHP